MKAFLKFLWRKYCLGCQNIKWGYCSWNCSYRALGRQEILIDDEMCLDCWEQYIEEFK